MASLRVANRYAEALMEETKRLHSSEEVVKDLILIRNLLRQSAELRQLVKSPVIKKEKKSQAIRAVFERSLNPATLRFLLLLVEKKRETILQDIIGAFFRMEKETRGIIDVHLKTASDLSDAQLDRMRQKFEAYSKKKVHFDISPDPQLIGGFVARIGDTVYDCSVKRQLELLYKRFVQGPAAVKNN
jgi:F-type H+-transporting ATPase subunit delta